MSSLKCFLCKEKPDKLSEEENRNGEEFFQILQQLFPSWKQNNNSSDSSSWCGKCSTVMLIAKETFIKIQQLEDKLSLIKSELEPLIFSKNSSQKGDPELTKTKSSPLPPPPLNIKIEKDDEKIQKIPTSPPPKIKIEKDEEKEESLEKCDNSVKVAADNNKIQNVKIGIEKQKTSPSSSPPPPKVKVKIEKDEEESLEICDNFINLTAAADDKKIETVKIGIEKQKTSPPPKKVKIEKDEESPSKLKLNLTKNENEGIKSQNNEKSVKIVIEIQNKSSSSSPSIKIQNVQPFQNLTQESKDNPKSNQTQTYSLNTNDDKNVKIVIKKENEQDTKKLENVNSNQTENESKSDQLKSLKNEIVTENEKSESEQEITFVPSPESIDLKMDVDDDIYEEDDDVIIISSDDEPDEPIITIDDEEDDHFNPTIVSVSSLNFNTNTAKTKESQINLVKFNKNDNNTTTTRLRYPDVNLTCNYCKQRFRNRVGYHSHKCLEEEKRGKEISCFYCNKKFSLSAQMYAHATLAHPNDKRFKCPQENCNQSFVLPLSVQEHVKTVHHQEVVVTARGSQKTLIYQIDFSPNFKKNQIDPSFSITNLTNKIQDLSNSNKNMGQFENYLNPEINRIEDIFEDNDIEILDFSQESSTSTGIFSQEEPMIITSSNQSEKSMSIIHPGQGQPCPTGHLQPPPSILPHPHPLPISIHLPRTNTPPNLKRPMLNPTLVKCETCNIKFFKEEKSIKNDDKIYCVKCTVKHMREKQKQQVQGHQGQGSSNSNLSRFKIQKSLTRPKVVFTKIPEKLQKRLDSHNSQCQSISAKIKKTKDRELLNLDRLVEVHDKEHKIKKKQANFRQIINQYKNIAPKSNVKKENPDK